MAYLLLTKPGCSRCTRAKALLKAHHEAFAVNEHDTPAKLQRFQEAGYTAFPAVFHDGVFIGGLPDLEAHLED